MASVGTSRSVGMNDCEYFMVYNSWNMKKLQFILEGALGRLPRRREASRKTPHICFD